MARMIDPQQRRGQPFQRRLALGDLDGRELLCRALGDLSIEQRGDDGAHAEARESQGDDGGDGDQQQLQADGQQLPAGRPERVVEPGDVHGRLA